VITRPRPRGAITGRSTRYEIGAYRRGETAPALVLAYILAPTRSALIAAARTQADAVLGLMSPAEQEAPATFRAGVLALGGGAVAIRKTGRTEREASA
jgi:hypothetical protein